jgi:hypothetical protein
MSDGAVEDIPAGRTVEEGLLYLAWGVIANASEGNWEREPQEWQDAAHQWRDDWHAYLEGKPPRPGLVSTEPTNE